jgi:hypothetical protein
VLAQLAEDIEAAGGLSKFDENKSQGLSELLDHRSITLQEPECYGIRGSEQRKKISQKVKRWKIQTKRYLTDLEKFEVKPFASRKATRGTARTASAPGTAEEFESYLNGFESLTIKAGSRGDTESMSDLDQDEFQEPALKRNKSRTGQELPSRANMSSNMSSTRVIRINPDRIGKKSMKLAQRCCCFCICITPLTS